MSNTYPTFQGLKQRKGAFIEKGLKSCSCKRKRSLNRRYNRSVKTKKTLQMHTMSRFESLEKVTKDAYVRPLRTSWFQSWFSAGSSAGPQTPTDKTLQTSHVNTFILHFPPFLVQLWWSRLTPKQNHFMCPQRETVERPSWMLLRPGGFVAWQPADVLPPPNQLQLHLSAAAG